MTVSNLNIINEICSTSSFENNVFYSTKCLTYIDEFDQKLEGKKKSTSIVSLTCLMNNYIEDLEKKWLINVRDNYGFNKGEAIHFTKVRKISQTVTYNSDGVLKESVGWNDDYILMRANKLIDYTKKKFKPGVKGKVVKDFVEEYKVWNLFRKEDTSGFGSLDTEKLICFYEDIFLIIKEANFDILCTTILYDTNALHRNSAFHKQTTSPHTIAFGEHLDLLCFYLKNGFSHDTGNTKSLSTKLRWDGDDGFNLKNDYRMLFNKLISLGTTHYQAETVRKCLDEIRFVNKSEIGFYDNIENPKVISHIGCDIADFITYFVGKISVKNELIQIYKSDGLTCAESIQKFNDTVTFKIGDRLFIPYDEILIDKILNKDTYTSIQKFNECHYSQW